MLYWLKFESLMPFTEIMDQFSILLDIRKKMLFFFCIFRHRSCVHLLYTVNIRAVNTAWHLRLPLLSLSASSWWDLLMLKRCISITQLAYQSKPNTSLLSKCCATTRGDSRTWKFTMVTRLRKNQTGTLGINCHLVPSKLWGNVFLSYNLFMMR